MVEEASYSAGELPVVGVQDGKVLQPRVPWRRWFSSLTGPCVQGDVVVVVPGGQERRPGQAEVRAVCGHDEVQHIAVEGCRPFEVSNAQVNVADADMRMGLAALVQCLCLLSVLESTASWRCRGRV